MLTNLKPQSTGNEFQTYVKQVNIWNALDCQTLPIYKDIRTAINHLKRY